MLPSPVPPLPILVLKLFFGKKLPVLKWYKYTFVAPVKFIMQTLGDLGANGGRGSKFKINCAEFCRSQLRGFNSVGVKVRHLPLTWRVAVNTVLALPRSL